MPTDGLPRRTAMNDARPTDAWNELERSRDRWRLTPDGAPFQTHSSWLQPVRHHDVPAVLKVAFEEEERRGAALMVWWSGEGAARILAHEGNALLLERATGTESLVEMARSGRDDDASRTLCAVASRLHASRERTFPELVPPDSLVSRTRASRLATWRRPGSSCRGGPRASPRAP